MTVEITRPGKNSLTVETPVMPAAGTFGFGDVYSGLVNLEKLGALVTSPVTYQPWKPATGTRVVPLDGGVLVHTGLPNRGLTKTLDQYRGLWSTLPLPVILHLVATTLEHIQTSLEILENEDTVDAVELGLNDDLTPEEVKRCVKTAADHTEKPLLVRLPLLDSNEMAEVAAKAGADALVIAAPPRGTARDPLSGRLVSGRLYGPVVKPMVLRLVGQLVRRIDIPIIGAGGIHSPQDARDFLEAGARAVQVDSVTWIQPFMLEIIARDLGGRVVTRAMDAFPDEWHPGMGETTRRKKQKGEKSTPSAEEKP